MKLVFCTLLLLIPILGSSQVLRKTVRIELLDSAQKNVSAELDLNLDDFKNPFIRQSLVEVLEDDLEEEFIPDEVLTTQKRPIRLSSEEVLDEAEEQLKASGMLKMGDKKMLLLAKGRQQRLPEGTTATLHINGRSYLVEVVEIDRDGYTIRTKDLSRKLKYTGGDSSHESY